MKRSNRLFLLLGIVLAVVAAGGVLLLGGGGGGTSNQPTPPPAEIDVVTAAVDIPLGKQIAAEDLTTKKAAKASLPSDVVTSTELAVGRTARQAIRTGELLTSSMFTGGAGTVLGDSVQRALEQGFRAIAVQVDQITGVGTVIQAGDRVDVLISLEDTDGKFPVLVEVAPTREGTPPTAVRNFKTVDELLNNTSVKVLVQNAQVLGTLLPPPPAETQQGGQQPPASPQPGQGSEPTTSLTGQQQIVIIAVTPQQVELVRFAQLDGNLSLVLRSKKDDATPPDVTTGITLRELIDRWGVLPPRAVLTELP